MMNRQIIDICSSDFQNCSVPVEVVIAGRNDLDGRVDRLHFLDVAVEIVGVGRGIAMSTYPVAPNLVSDLPVANVEWLRIAVWRAESAMFGVRISVALLDPC